MTRSGIPHTVDILPTGQTQLFIGLHLIHEVTSPQAFAMMREQGLQVAFPELHVCDRRPHRPDGRAEAPVPRRAGRGDDPSPRECHVRDYRIEIFGMDDERQGIVHIIGPQLGLTPAGHDAGLRR